MANDALVAIGEALIDFIPDKKGCEFYEVTSFAPSVGGAPANVCGAFSKLGGKSKMITQLGNDPFGDKIIKRLKEAGIDTSCISRTDKANTALAFVSLAKDGNRTFSFYRNPSADMLLDKDTLKKEWFDDCFALHFCSVSLGDFPMRGAHEKAIEYAKKSGALISFDPNLRFQLWNSREALRETVRKFIALSDILKISDEELEFITGETDLEKALPKLFRGGVKLVLYTLGSKGAYAITPEMKLFSPPYSVIVADTTGAGDGFVGSFLWKLKENGIDASNISDISEGALKEALDFANKFCAISVQYPGAIDSYPNHKNMKSFKNNI